MATHHVSLFLPETVAFHKPPSSAARRSSTPPPTADLRRGSSVDLPLRPPSLSILNGPTPPRTPSITDDIFASKPGTDKLLSREPGDPRSLVHSDAHVPDWGVQAIFNQPKSRAGLLPSASILDFAKVHEEVVKEREEARRAATKRISPTSRSSRAGSHDRSYEGKEWTVKPAIQGNGGLTNAVRAVAESDETEIHWIGTIGFPTDTLPQALKEDIHDKMVIDHNSQVIFVSDKDFDGHYAHYCKTILWPIFHYQVPDHPKSKAYADHSWEFYRNVNQAFADKIIDSYKRGDTIWIHDYHLLLVPAMVRQKLPDAKIGFFLHTAFPSSEVFRCLSTRKALLDGMLGANLIAFQTDEYTHHFLQTCSRLLTVETTAEGVQLDDHFVNVTSQPIGLNLRAMDKERKEPEVQEWIDIIQERYKDKKIIVARDKLDNVRGVRQKLLAYELFLNKHPEWREKVVLIASGLSGRRNGWQRPSSVRSLDGSPPFAPSTSTSPQRHHTKLSFVFRPCHLPSTLPYLPIAHLLPPASLLQHPRLSRTPPKPNTDSPCLFLSNSTTTMYGPTLVLLCTLIVFSICTSARATATSPPFQITHLQLHEVQTGNTTFSFIVHDPDPLTNATQRCAGEWTTGSKGYSQGTYVRPQQQRGGVHDC
ncbi:Trehalose-6-P synthase/phosphatase complex subunit [Friedmanniomyces endolithicus]|nr:Trehalose-6-P synthase/phosphatase complex subunit [Friedmanniomyces endolithicus]